MIKMLDLAIVAGLRFARWLAPPVRRDWLDAMVAECESIGSRFQRVLFALGMVWVAFTGRVESDHGVAMLGKAALAIVLFALGGVGLVLASDMPKPVGDAVTIACAAYAGAGVAALHSLRSLASYAATCSLFALFALAGSAFASDRILLRNFQVALLMEGLALMTALFIASLCLPHLRWQTND